ncbi:hypothetical protein [Kluyvera georgiana]|uniref:hypothetical protein n=1 Tax=Kluyvera georgiana TaxID=73098 RepID=UPI003D96CE91
MTSLIKVPFASSGDKTAVPDTDATGAVNMTQGYGQAYSLDPATDPSAKRIERDKMNWLFNRITQAINEIQVSGVAPFITSTDNGGSPFSYDKGAIVSLSGAVYQSLTAANTTTPPGANWSLLPEKIQPLDATLTALAGLTGAADRLAYFNGVDTAALTALTSVGRDIIGKATVADVLTYLSLGNSATRNVGTTAGTVAAGDDSRITGAVQTTSAALCTAWVNFSGVSPATIRGSLNVSSVTRLQTGQYQINYATPLANSNYAPVLTLGDAPNAGTLAAVVAISGSATGSPVKKDVDGIIVQARASNTVADVSEFNVVIFGGR